MTARWRAPEPEEPINAWIRAHPELHSVRAGVVVTNTDMWVHRYRGPHDRDVQYLMQVEIKTHGAALSDTQRDTLHIVNQVMRTVPWRDERQDGQFVGAHRQNVRNVKAWSPLGRRWIRVVCYGQHVWRLSGATPADSDWMVWDEKPVTVDQVIRLLRFELHPDSLSADFGRRHKAKHVDWPQLPLATS